MKDKKISKRQMLLLFGDICIILLSLYLGLLIRAGQSLIDFVSINEVFIVVSLVINYIASFYIFEFYNTRFKFRSSKFLASMGGAFALAYFLAILSFYVFPYRLSRSAFLISWFLAGLLVYSWRLAYVTKFKLAEPQRNVLILGNGSTKEPIIEALKGDPEYRLGAILDIEDVKERLHQEATPGAKGTIEYFVEKNKINDIVVNLNADVSSLIEQALVKCRMKGISCYTAEAFYERLLEKLPVLMLNDRWFLMSGGFDKLGNRLYKTFKRAVDFVIAVFILLITIPLSALIALLIPLTSKGPVLFTQQRLGAGRKAFKVIKFRTMVHNAEANGPQWAQNNDGRVTKLGKILRKTRLDEMPQLINVLKGEMSMIGPRPERKYFVDQLEEKIPFYSLRFFVKPGITGWAQVNFHYGSNDEDALEKLRYELYYIKNQSLFLDFRIIMKTIRVVFFGLGT